MSDSLRESSPFWSHFSKRIAGLTLQAMTLRTARLVLEPTRAEHGPGLWTATNVSLPELKRWMVWAVGVRWEDSHYFAREAEKMMAAGDGHHFTIFHEDETAGVISLIRGEPRLGYLEVGYWLRSDLCGRGLMTEALRAACRHAFDEIGMHRLELRAGVDNTASRRVAEKAGFQERGILRDSVYENGRYVDAVIFDLLAEDLSDQVAGTPGRSSNL